MDITVLKIQRKQHKIERMYITIQKFTHYNNCTSRRIHITHRSVYKQFFFSCWLRERQNDSYSCYMAASFHPATLLFFRIKDHYYVNNSSFWTMPLAKAPTNKVFYLTQSQYPVWCITILFSRPVFFLFFLIWFDFKILYTQTITGDYNMFWSFSLLLWAVLAVLSYFICV